MCYQISKLNSADETVNIDCFRRYTWKDEKLIGKEGELNPSEIWKISEEYKPVESVEFVTKEEESYFMNDHQVAVGHVNHSQRVKIVVQIPLHLHNFPFDKQIIKLNICSFYFADEVVEFIDGTEPAVMDNLHEKLALSEWELDGRPSIDVKPVFEPAEHRSYSTVTLSIPVRRLVGFYFQKVIFLTFVIGLLVCLIPILHADDLSSRFQINLALLLSQIAFQFAVGSSLPRVNYSTKLDYYFYFNYGFILLNGIENIVVFLLTDNLPDPNSTLPKYIDWATIILTFLIHIISTGYLVFLGWLSIRSRGHPSVAAQRIKQA